MPRNGFNRETDDVGVLSAGGGIERRWQKFHRNQFSLGVPVTMSSRGQSNFLYLRFFGAPPFAGSRLMRRWYFGSRSKIKRCIDVVHLTRNRLLNVPVELHFRNHSLPSLWKSRGGRHEKNLDRAALAITYISE